MMKITSLQNSLIKNLIKLQQKSRERRKQGVFVAEGIQENSLAIKNSYKPVKYFINTHLFNDSFDLKDNDTVFVDSKVYEHIAYRGTTEGIIGVYESKKLGLTQIPKKDNYFIVVLEAVEKPGNLGAILRSADATNVDAVVVCDPKVDFFNPNVIRSSVGTVFTNTLATCTFDEFIEFAKENSIKVFPTFLNETTSNLYQNDLKQSSALIFGTEATGLSDKWNKPDFTLIKIPMLGQVDSLNVSNAVVVCLYEVIRQRQFSLIK